MKILAFDPGITTGYAIGQVGSGVMHVVTGQEKYTHLPLYNMIKVTKPHILLVESFEFRNRSRKGLVLYSLELIGVIELYGAHYKVPVMRQTAMQGKSYYNDVKLKKDGLFKSARPHANDACRHLLHWYTFGSGYQYNKKGYKLGA